MKIFGTAHFAVKTISAKTAHPVHIAAPKMAPTKVSPPSVAGGFRNSAIKATMPVGGLSPLSAMSPIASPATPRVKQALPRIAPQRRLVVRTPAEKVPTDPDSLS